MNSATPLTRWIGAVALAFTIAAPAFSQNSGFMEDYSLLEKRKGDDISSAYVAPGAESLMADYTTVIVDQPEVFVASDSKYKGAKPDHLKGLADTLRETLMSEVESSGYVATDGAAPNAVYLRWAITDLYLQKKKRGLLSFTPVGFVVHSTTQAATRDLWKKIDIVELNIEAEFIDASTGELLAAAIIERGMRKDKKKKQKQDLVSWEELDATMQTVAKRVVCNLNNAKASAKEDCSQISVAVPKKK